MRITSSLRPEASVAASSVACDRVQVSGIRVVGVRQATGKRRDLGPRTGRACRYGRRYGRSTRPWSSQMILLRAEGSRSAASACALRPAIAIVVEQGLPRGEDRALTVMLDGAAFQHEVESADRRAGKPRDVVADGGVVGQVEFAAPAIGPKSQRDRAVFRSREDRARVAEPDIAVARRNDLGRAARARRGPRPRLRRPPPAAHPVRSGSSARTSAATSRRGRRQVAVPLVRIGRPSGPDGLLRRPFRGNGNLLGNGNSHQFLLVVAPSSAGLGRNRDISIPLKGVNSASVNHGRESRGRRAGKRPAACLASDG